MRGILITVLLWSGLAFSNEKVATQNSSIDEIAKKEIASGRILRLTIGVARGDEVIYSRGFGIADIENSVPATEKTVYRIGSITKMFTAVAILMLIEEGALHLDDPLTKYLPDYPDPKKVITIRHLLQHTSGLANITDLPGFRKGQSRDVKPEALPSIFQNEPVHFAPGEKFRYCNSGYLLLGLILEKVSGENYEDFLTEKILAPLEMTTTSYDRPARIVPHRARGYSVWGNNKVNARYVSMTQPYAAGALISTAGDLLKWIPGLAAETVISEESFQKMASPGQLNNGTKTRYGLGCFVEKLEGETVIRHGGGIGGFVSELGYAPESKLSVVVLTNTGGNFARRIANEVMHLYLHK